MKRFIFPILIAAALFSCTKENSDEFIPNNGADTVWAKVIPGNAPIRNLYSLLAASTSVSFQPETKTCDADAGGTIAFKNGVSVYFPPGVFGPGVSGNVSVSLQYLKSKGDMIRNWRPIESNGRLLETGGAFNITATQNGTLLQIPYYTGFNITYPTTNPDPEMKVFFGDSSSTNDNGFTWVPAQDSSFVDTSIVETDSGSVFLYNLISQELNWINCDRFSDTSMGTTTVYASLPSNFTNQNTSVWIVFKDYNGAMNLWSDFDNKIFYHENIPIGSNVTFLSLSQIGDDFYLGIQDAVITQGLSITLSPEKKTLDEISDYINSL